MKSIRLIPLIFLLAGIPQRGIAQTNEPSIAITLETSRDPVFQNEVFDLTIVVRSAGVRLGKTFELMSLPGAQALSIGAFQELPSEQALEAGQTKEIRRFRCPARAVALGTLSLAPVMRLGVLQRQTLFIGYTWAESRIDVAVQPRSLLVRPLPEAPAGVAFSGAIGRFDFDVKVSPTDIAVGDLVTVTMKVRGNGYLESATPPRLALDGPFKTYDPRLSAESSDAEKTFEQIVVPQSTNAARVAAVSFAFFDPVHERYETLARGPFPLSFHAPRRATLDLYRPNTLPSGDSPEPAAPDSADSRSSSVRHRAAIVVYWALTAILTWAWGRASRWRKVSAVMTVVLAVAVFPWARTRIDETLSPVPTATLIAGETARLAPSRNSAPLFEAPLRASVRVLAVHRAWAKISLGERRGWVPRHALDILPFDRKSPRE